MFLSRAGLCLCVLFLSDSSCEDEEEEEVTIADSDVMTPEEEYVEAIRCRDGFPLEIDGIPETKHEDLAELVKKYGRLITVADVNSVKEARRFRIPGTTAADKQTYIVVEMNHESCAQEWIRKCHEHREITADIFDENSGRTEIFVKDYVPERVKKLLAEAKRVGKEHGYVIVWYKGNSTYMKKPGGKQLKVSSLKELQQLIDTKAF